MTWQYLFFHLTSHDTWGTSVSQHWLTSSNLARLVSTPWRFGCRFPWSCFLFMLGLFIYPSRPIESSKNFKVINWKSKMLKGSFPPWEFLVNMRNLPNRSALTFLSRILQLGCPQQSHEFWSPFNCCATGLTFSATRAKAKAKAKMAKKPRRRMNGAEAAWRARETWLGEAASARLTPLFCWDPRHIPLGLDNWHRDNLNRRFLKMAVWGKVLQWKGHYCSRRDKIILLGLRLALLHV